MSGLSCRTQLQTQIPPLPPMFLCLCLCLRLCMCPCLFNRCNPRELTKNPAQATNGEKLSRTTPSGVHYSLLVILCSFHLGWPGHGCNMFIFLFIVSTPFAPHQQIPMLWVVVDRV